MNFIFFAFVAAVFCALAVHEITWVLRRQAINWLSAVGGVSIAVFFIGLAIYLLVIELYSDSAPFDPEINVAASPAQILRVQATVVLVGLGVLVVISLLGLLHKKQIPCVLWKSILAMWAEFGLLAIFIYCVYYFLGFVRYDERVSEFQFPAWELWFMRLTLIFCLLLAVACPFKEKTIPKVLQTYHDSFRLNYQWKKSKF